jgi:hypothetical protein
LALPLDEADAEVSPIVIADDDQASFWSVYQGGTGTSGLTISNESTIKTDGTNSLKMVAAAGSYLLLGINHTYETPQNWSTKSRNRLKFYGANTGYTFRLKMGNDASNYYYWDIVDNFTGWLIIASKMLGAPAGTVGTPTGLSAISHIRLDCMSNNPLGTWYLDRFVVDVGVPAVDYSGNANNGTAIGTTIEDGRFVGKKARHFGSGERLAGTTLGYDTSATKSVFFLAKSENIAKDWAAMFTDGMQHFQGSSNGSYAIQFHNGTQNISMGTGNNALANNVWKPVGSTFNRETGKFAVYDNGTLSAEVSCAVGTFADNPNWIAGSTIVGLSFIGSLACIIVVTGILTDTQFDSMYNNYPDTRLITGSVLVRKWATTTLPSFCAWGAVETVEDGYSTETDYSGNSNNGTATGTTVQTTSTKFAGKNVRNFIALAKDKIVTTTKVIETDEDFTVFVSAKANSVAVATQHLLRQGTGFYVRLTGQNVRAYVWGTTAGVFETDDNPVNNTTSYFDIVFKYNATTGAGKIFVNGVERHLGTDTACVSPTNSNNVLHIGASEVSSDTFWMGVSRVRMLFKLLCLMRRLRFCLLAILTHGLKLVKYLCVNGLQRCFQV